MPESNVADSFIRIREKCPVLHDIIIQDEIWSEYKKAINNPIGKAQHQPIIFLSHLYGCLSHITIPMHKYITDKINEGSILQAQYKSDLKENWFFEPDEIRRNKHANEFKSRLAEIILINYLSSKGFIIENYEAIGSKYDIEYINENLNFCAELKYIGQEKNDFLTFLEAIQKGASSAILSPYLAYNFLLLRVFDAARQLASSAAKKAVYIMIGNSTIHRFKFQIEDKWINWQMPEFFNHSDWSLFMQMPKNKKKYANIENELTEIIRLIDEISILHLTDEYQINELLKVKI